MSHLDNLPLAKNEDGFPMEVSFIDRKFSVQYRLYEPSSEMVDGNVVYTHVFDIDLAREQDARDWMYAYNFFILVSDHGDPRQDSSLKQKFRDHSQWAVANSKYETVRDGHGFTFTRITFKNNPPASLVIG
jgi:hypothetical protein